MIGQRSQLRTVGAILALAAFGLAMPVEAAGSTRTVTKFGDWTLYEHDDGASRICFLSAAPRSSIPKDQARGPVQLFVSVWPKDGVKGEISVKLGYAAKKSIPVTVTVGKDAFRLFAAGDRAFVQDPTAELKLIEAVKKGTSLVVQATPETGAATTDTFSLQGLTQGLQSLATGCP
jgi:invasion protein IalB